MELWTEGWYFLKTPVDTTWDEMEERRDEFIPVSLPHDWLIGQIHNLYEDGFGWYRKVFSVNECERERILVRFDGVYMDCSVYVNEMHVTDWKYGYTTFDADITEFVTKGRNEITVLVRHRSPNSRWYSGAGIFRNVWIKFCGKDYLPLDGTYVVIRPKGAERERNNSFTLEVNTEVSAGTCHTLFVEYRLVRENSFSAECCQPERDEAQRGLSGHWKVPVNKESGDASLITVVENPDLWDVDSPNCYLLQVRLKSSDELLDYQEITVGFRSLSITADEGLFLNGRNLKIKGVCLHHDLGCLGSAFHEAALRRQFTIMKEMGVNGLRTSHNPPAPEFMEMADRMGFLVDAEAFDMWERPKTTYDYARFFKEWAKKDVRSWIRRDRNHPSVFLWSIGNEIYDTHADSYGQEITKRLIGYVREHDPRENAHITIGSNYMPWEGAQNCADLVKVAGYNYGEKYYQWHHKEHPDWVIYGSETASVVMSRGIYHFPLSQTILADEDEQCSALGNSCTSWGAQSIEQVIMTERDTTFSFGQFVWTGFDYIGEPTPYHTKNSYFGQVDTAGFPKDQFYIFQSAWRDVSEYPMVHIFPYWDFNPGQMIDVRVATNASQVELLVNGRRQGRRRIDHEKGTVLLGNWQVPYETGELMAIAYDKNGKEIARERRLSFADSHQICLSADRTELAARGRDLGFITIETLDEKGHFVENASDYVTVHVEGPAMLLGMDNGDSTDDDPYLTDTRKLFSGKLLAVIGTTGETGMIKVTATGNGLCAGQILLEAVDAGQKAAAFTQKLLPSPHVWIPTRKIELYAPEGNHFTNECRELPVAATVHPKGACPELIWKAVNDAGIEVPMARCCVMKKAGSFCEVAVKALGDGDFRVRCMAKEASGRITVISQLEFHAEGIGTAFLNPYEFVSAGLYMRSFGEIGTGNEKGIATSREGACAICFDHVDFGERGSDEITIPIFALDDEEYHLEVWEGMPDETGSEMLGRLSYQKNSIWNVYQDETWKLRRRLKGVTSIAIKMAEQKVHIKGFTFRRIEKAFDLIYAGEADRIYGDAFKQIENRVEEIGNNVTMEFEHMDFGETGTSKLTICGWTGLAVNTVHIRFRPYHEEQMCSCAVEFAGTDSGQYVEQTFTIKKLTGNGRLDLIFLPGSKFNLESFRFHSEGE